MWPVPYDNAIADNFRQALRAGYSAACTSGKLAANATEDDVIARILSDRCLNLLMWRDDLDGQLFL